MLVHVSQCSSDTTISTMADLPHMFLCMTHATLSGVHLYDHDVEGLESNFCYAKSVCVSSL